MFQKYFRKCFRSFSEIKFPKLHGKSSRKLVETGLDKSETPVQLVRLQTCRLNLTHRARAGVEGGGRALEEEPVADLPP